MQSTINVAELSADDRAALLRQLQTSEEAPAAVTEAEPANKRTPLDLSDAEAVCWAGDLVTGERVRHQEYLGQTLWSFGHNNAKGPKGGVYFYGRAVVAQKKGMLKVAKRAFDAFRSGGSMEAWIRFDGDATDTLVGVVTHFRPAKTPSVGL